MKSVGILLATYNGERYLEAFLDSVLAQTYPDVTLYVWDDGSTDRTPEILRAYEARGVQVVNYDKHVGYPFGFYELFRSCGGKDIYFLADQDDIWLPDKVESAVEMLAGQPEGLPNLYYSAYTMVDDQLKFIRKSPEQTRPLDFLGTLFECRPLGFNMAFTKEAFDMMAATLPEREACKDIWIQMICAAFGTIVYDPVSHVLYRRNDGAVTFGNSSWITTQIWRVRKFFVNDGFAGLCVILKEFEDVYGPKLREEDRRELHFFNGDHRLAKTLYPHRLRLSDKDELMLRAVFLLGKM